jgi:hypothetical protein
MDNLSTHTARALYVTFPAPRRIASFSDWIPLHAQTCQLAKHGEIEIGVLRGQCLDRRIGERDLLQSEIAEWQRKRNASGARIQWRFTTTKPAKS